MTQMRVSEIGMDFIARWEGRRPRMTAKRCLGDRFEVSYGITFYPDGTPVKEGDTITWAKHLEMFRYALSVFEKEVNARLTFTPNQHQFDALVAFAWNVGAGNFRTSSVLRHANAQRWEDAAEAFALFKYATTKYENDRKTLVRYEGKPVKWKAARRGLVRRHYGEGMMFLGMDPTFLHEDVDLVEMDIRRDWHPPVGDKPGYYKDSVLYVTPFKEILEMAEPLESPVYVNEKTPDVMAEAPKPRAPSKTKSAKKILNSRTIWGGGILAVAATPEFEGFASQMIGAGEGIAGGAMTALGLILVVIGRVGAGGPIPITGSKV